MGLAYSVVSNVFFNNVTKCMVLYVHLLDFDDNQMQIPATPPIHMHFFSCPFHACRSFIAFIIEVHPLCTLVLSLYESACFVHCMKVDFVTMYCRIESHGARTTTRNSIVQ